MIKWLLPMKTVHGTLAPNDRLLLQTNISLLSVDKNYSIKLYLKLKIHGISAGDRNTMYMFAMNK